jgi:hypothetical protein
MAAGNAAERYLQEGSIQLPLWQWQSPWLTEIDAYVAFLSRKEKKIAWYKVRSVRRCGKAVTYHFASTTWTSKDKY